MPSYQKHFSLVLMVVIALTCFLVVKPASAQTPKPTLTENQQLASILSSLTSLLTKLLNLAANLPSNNPPATNSLSQVAYAQVSPLDSLQAGQWYQAPNIGNATIRSVLPPDLTPTSTAWGNGPQSIINAWNSGAYDTKRNRLIVWGGGHGDYGGNEMYAFDLGTLTWSRIWGPSVNIPSLNCNEAYPDGNPASRHTYDGLEYLPNLDKFFVQGGSPWTCGTPSIGTWTFDFSTLTWQPKATILPLGSYTELEVVSAYDPVTGHIFVASPTLQLFEYDPVVNTWTQRGTDTVGYGGGGTHGGGGKVAAIDPVRRKFIVVGVGEAWQYDLSLSGLAPMQPLTLTGDIPQFMASAVPYVLGQNYPGFAYDSAISKFVAWSGGANVYTLDLGTNTWKLITPSPSNTVIPTAANDNGTYGRWRYIPSKDLFIVVNSIDENVYFYRLSTSATPLAPDTTPPTIPTGLTATVISSSSINLSWNPSTDPIVAGQITSGMAGYKILRNNVQIATTPSTTTTYSDTNLTASTTYTYAVSAYDVAGNNSSPSPPVSVTTFPGVNPPTVSITSPLNNQTVSNIITIQATASSSIGIAGVQFKLDNVNLGTEITTPPYFINWNTSTTANGLHALTAVARDVNNNLTTSSGVAVNVSNVSSSTPTGLTATAVSSTQINLSWNAATGAVVGYKLFRNSIQIATVSALSFQDTGLTPATTYSYTVAAYDASQNTSPQSLPATATTLPGSSTGQINLPLKQWVGLPNLNPEFAYSGAKHMTGALDPDNGRIYYAGGDHMGGYFTIPDPAMMSYRNEVYSFSLKDKWADKQNHAAGWRLEYPYCGPAGEVQANRPDFMGWTWDSKRHVFWIVPGLDPFFDNTSCIKNPATLQTDGFRQLMTFNPVTQKWASIRDVPYDNNDNWGATYDPITDSLIRFKLSNIEIYNISANSWTYVPIQISGQPPGIGFDGSTIQIWMGLVSTDLNARVVYVIDSYSGRLYGYHMDTKILEDLGNIPGGPELYEDSSFNQPHHVWDSVNKVLLYFRYPDKFFAYHPDTKVWEQLTTVSDIPNTIAFGHVMVFDSQQNAVVLFGIGRIGDLVPGYVSSTNTILPGSVAATIAAGMPDIFFYRYGNGSSTPPTLLTVAITTPISSSTVSGTSVPLSVTTSPGVVGVQFKLDGVNLGAEVTTPPYSIFWNSTAAANGSHTLTATARDAVGSQTTSAPITVIVSNTVSLSASPLTGIAPLNGITLTAQTLGTAQGTINYTFYCNRSDTGVNITTPYDFKQNNTTLTTYTTAPLCNYTTPGTYTAKVIVERGTLVAEARTTIVVSPNTTPPVISGIVASQITTSTAQITWLTDKPATDFIEYGLTTAYGAQTPESSTYLTSHSQTLTNLQGGAIYHYRVKSRDQSGNLGISLDNQFQTLPSVNTTPPNPIVNLSASNIQTNSLTLSWTAPADPPSMGSAASYSLRYSTSPLTEANWSSATPATGLPNPATPGQTQTYILAGLTPNTTYYIAIKSADVSGNISSLSNSISVTTASQPSGGGGGGGGAGGGGGGGGPIITIAPPSNFQTKGASNQIILSWKNPLDPNFVRVMVMRDSQVIYEGDKEGFIDTNLLPQKIYSYSIVSLDRNLNPSPALTKTSSLGEVSDIEAQKDISQSILKPGVSLPLFTKFLYLGRKDPEVKHLQEFLNGNGFTIATKGIGSPGKETTYFGPATRKAIRQFQCKYRILCKGKAWGQVGPVTRAKLNELLHIGGNLQQLPTIPTAPTASQNTTQLQKLQQLLLQLQALQQQLKK